MLFFKKLSRREKLTIVIALAFLITGLYYVRFFEPVVNEIKLMREKRDSLRTQYDLVLMRIRKNLPEVRKGISELEAQYGDVLRNFPNRSEVSQFLLMIEAMATNHGMTLELFSPKPMEIEGEFYQMPIDIAFTSTYEEMVAFIYALENSAKRMDVLGFEIRRSNDLTDLELHVDMRLKVYITKDT